MRGGLGRILAAGLLFAAAMTPAHALTTITTQFNVTATVLANCAVSATNLVFGTYTASSGTPLTASSTVSVTCTNSLAYTVALDGGSVAANVAAREMSDGATHVLSYQLYTANTYASIWGDGTASTVTVAGTGNGAAQPLTVYGRIPSAQFVTAGNYLDHVTVSVTY
jgi:spore coat protein U-like protein